MRLLDTTTFALQLNSQEFFKRGQGYAILSHRWVGSEIKFHEIAQHASSLRKAIKRVVRRRDGPGEKWMQSPQLDKIRGACEIARKEGFRWIWIDNCCIDKSNATEESESINSMFKWYRDARLCITYLSDVNLDVSGHQATNPDQEENRLTLWPSSGVCMVEIQEAGHARSTFPTKLLDHK